MKFDSMTTEEQEIIDDFFEKLQKLIIKRSNLVIFSKQEEGKNSQTFIPDNENLNKFTEDVHNLFDSFSNSGKDFIIKKYFDVEEEDSELMYIVLYEDFKKKRKNLFPILCFFFGKDYVKNGKKIKNVMPKIVSKCIPIYIPYIYNSSEEMDEITQSFCSSQENKKEFVDLVSKGIFITYSNNDNTKLIS